MRCLNILLVLGWGLGLLPAVDAPVLAATAPTYKRVTIGNESAQVEVSNYRASIGSFRLASSRGILPPAWKRLKNPDGTEVKPDPKEWLEALSNQFNDARSTKSITDMHSYPFCFRLGQDPGGYPLEGPWRFVETTKERVVLEHAEAATGLVWRVTYHMAQVEKGRKRPRPTVHATLEMLNNGPHTFNDINAALVPLNGIHQDDPSSDRGYTYVVHHYGNSLDDWDKFYFPAAGAKQFVHHPQQDGNAFPASAFEYIALQGKFFSAWWKLDGFRIENPASPTGAVPPPPSSSLSDAGEVSTGTPRQCRISVEAKGFTQKVGREECQQAMLRVFFRTPDNNTCFALSPGQRLVVDWSISVASMQPADLETLTPNEQRLQYTDWWFRNFKLLSALLKWVLGLFNSVVGNYGVAILLLTVLIKAALHRANFKAQKSFGEMSKLQPEIQELQKRYGHDPRTLQMKQLELFKKHDVNPLRGCLPILVQFPIFVALFQTFNHAADMRGTGFLWMGDLTLPDQTLFLGFDLPLFGIPFTLNALPIIYLAVSLWTSLAMKVPPNASDQQAQMTRMMRWMPFAFAFIFYNMPAGLVLYFTCSAVLGNLESKYIKHKLGLNDPPKPKAPATR